MSAVMAKVRKKGQQCGRGYWARYDKICFTARRGLDDDRGYVVCFPARGRNRDTGPKRRRGERRRNTRRKRGRRTSSISSSRSVPSVRGSPSPQPLFRLPPREVNYNPDDIHDRMPLLQVQRILRGYRAPAGLSGYTEQGPPARMVTTRRRGSRRNRRAPSSSSGRSMRSVPTVRRSPPPSTQHPNPPPPPQRRGPIQRDNVRRNMIRVLNEVGPPTRRRGRPRKRNRRVVNIQIP